MASISRQPNGQRTIQFVDCDKKRRSIRLGKVTAKDAEAIKSKIEHLLAAKLSGRAVDAEVAAWISKSSPSLIDRLASVGLVAHRADRAATKTPCLGEFLTEFVHKRADAKASTKLVFGRVRKHLVEFFGADRPLRSITPGDGCDWRQYLIGTAQLADNTVRRHCGIARQFFKAAIRHKLVTENPFSDEEIKVTVRGNEAKFHFVTLDDSARILAACHDEQWQLLFALSRFGGLRCPSEHLSLKWQHVDWEKRLITVPSPKTAHHEGKAERVMPLFPEIVPYLTVVREHAEPGTEWVITRYREKNSNLRTQFERIIRRAGLKPWPKLFHNLRATRQTELSDSFPQHVVAAWLGNSEAIATRHYLRTTTEHFERAVAESTQGLVKALQKAVQQTAEIGGNEVQAVRAPNEKAPVFQGLAARCLSRQRNRVGDEGLEPPTSTL